MADLDKSREFGTIFGDEEGRRFEQDGKFFDAMGQELSAKPKRGRPAKEDGDDQINKQLEG